VLPCGKIVRRFARRIHVITNENQGGLMKTKFVHLGKTLKLFAVLAGITAGAAPAQAASTYLSGHINNVTFGSSSIMIMLDTGLPDNCAGSPCGWMVVPDSYKSMVAFVLGLWMRGDQAEVGVTVYTDGLVNGYCRVNQIDPAN